MSVHQLKDGRWIVRYRKGRNPDRPNSTKKYFGRGPEAQVAALAYNQSLGLGQRTHRSSPVFNALANEYLAAKCAVMAASSMDTLVIRLRKTIAPIIGYKMAHTLTPAVMDAYVSERAKTVKLTTIRRELNDIRAIIRWSVRRRLININPMDGFEPPPADDARIQPPTEREFGRILQCAATHLQRGMLLAYHTGLRPGREELLSLCWDAVDFGNRTIMITSSKKGGLPIRMVPLNRLIIGELEKWHEIDQKTESRYIVNYHGYQISSLKTAWRSAKKRAGITRRIRLYDIRHRAITNMLEAGADLKSVAEIVGHASTDMTTRIYQHVSTDLKRRAVDLLLGAT